MLWKLNKVGFFRCFYFVPLRTSQQYVLLSSELKIFSCVIYLNIF